MVERGPGAFLALFRSALATILCSIDLVRRVVAVKKKKKRKEKKRTGKETWQRPGHKEDKTLLVEKKRGACKRGRRQAFSPPLWDLILVPSIPALLINHYRRRRRRRGCHSARLFSRATSFSCPFLKGNRISSLSICYVRPLRTRNPLYTVQLYSPRRCYLRNSPAKDFLRAPKVSSTSLEGDTYYCDSRWVLWIQECTSFDLVLLVFEKEMFFFSWHDSENMTFDGFGL